MALKDEIKLSICIPVLDSHEVVRRQILHFEKFLKDDTEVIIVDDGSNPPLKCDTNINISIIYTHDTRPWTWALALNKGCKEARGEFLLIYGIDHIATEHLVDCARNCDGDRMAFSREFAVLDENGDFTQDKEVLATYGLPWERMNSSKKLTLGTHNGMFAMRKTVWEDMGGYREDFAGKDTPGAEENKFKKKWNRYMQKHPEIKYASVKPVLYMFPNGKFCGDANFNPFGLFHNLSRKPKTEKV
jgi:glycosyltransferase involved in cell wall biosynthesis